MRHTRARAGPAIRLGEVAAAVGIGLAAGVVGTVAMTVSSTLEAKLRGREASTTPARAASKVLGVGSIVFSPLAGIGKTRAWNTLPASASSSAGSWRRCRKSS